MPTGFAFLVQIDLSFHNDPDRNGLLIEMPQDKVYAIYAYRKNRHQSPAMQLFLKFLDRFCKKEHEKSNISLYCFKVLITNFLFAWRARSKNSHFRLSIPSLQSKICG